MARACLIDCRGLAKKVKNADLPAEDQIKDCGAKRHCPNCDHLIDNSDVSEDWPGFPAGVKFSPSDVELLDHLAAKHGYGKLEPHPFIHDFIPTLEGNEGICYTHPENLPGAKKDGNSIHFFHKITNAYGSGQRKRRKIQDQESIVRWHKTGKTKPIMENGVIRGYKKIMVLYANSKGGSKPDKCNWVMHQYHLGDSEDETSSEYVVSKVFYQTQKDTEASRGTNESEAGVSLQVIPQTPKTNTPEPPRVDYTPSDDCGGHEQDYFLQCCLKETEHLENDLEYTSSIAGILNSDATFDDIRANNGSGSCGIADLCNLDFDTPPDFQLNDLQFASQDSVFHWFD